MVVNILANSLFHAVLGEAVKAHKKKTKQKNPSAFVQIGLSRKREPCL